VSAIDATARPSGPGVRALPGIALGALVLLVGTLLAVALYRYPPSIPVVLAVGVGMTGVLALALWSYEAAVVLGFLLFGIVKLEPAPTDAVFAIVMAVALVTGRFNVDRVPLAVFSLVGSFIVLNILSAIEAIDPQIAARFITITLYLCVFGIWLTSYVNSEHRARQVAIAYIVPATVFGLAATLAMFGPMPGGSALLAYDGTRATGLFEDPNVFGPFMVPAALIVLQDILDPRLLRARTSLKVAAFLILTGATLFSYSRAAWGNYVVGVVVLLAVLMMRRGGSRRALPMVVILIVTTLGVAGTLSATGSLSFLEERAHIQSYDTQRFGAQRFGIELAAEHPAGIGPGQFELRAPISAHSTYVRALAEQGVLGLAVIVALFLTTLIFAGSNAIAGRDTYGIGSAALLAAWIGLLVNSFVVDTLHWRHLWLVAALIWVGSMLRVSRPDDPRRARAAS
jgi:O-antigen ligase